jgi:hypothetical protein
MFVLNNLTLGEDDEMEATGWWLNFYHRAIEPLINPQTLEKMTAVGDATNLALAPIGAKAVLGKAFGSGWNFIFETEEDATAFVLRWC